MLEGSQFLNNPEGNDEIEIRSLLAEWLNASADPQAIAKFDKDFDHIRSQSQTAINRSLVLGCGGSLGLVARQVNGWGFRLYLTWI